MGVVTPVPPGNQERAGKLWHRRQELQAVLTSLSMIHLELNPNDDLELVVADRIVQAGMLVKEAMELLSPSPKPRVQIKRKPFPWDK